MSEFTLVISGYRDYYDYDKFKETVLKMLPQIRLLPSTVMIACGDARGTDALAVRFGNEAGVKVTVFNADWNTHGKRAGPIRNEKMLKFARSRPGGCGLIAFLSPMSKGTLSCINTASKLGIETKIFHV